MNYTVPPRNVHPPEPIMNDRKLYHLARADFTAINNQLSNADLLPQMITNPNKAAENWKSNVKRIPNLLSLHKTSKQTLICKLLYIETICDMWVTLEWAPSAGGLYCIAGQWQHSHPHEQTMRLQDFITENQTCYIREVMSHLCMIINTLFITYITLYHMIYVLITSAILKNVFILFKVS